MADNQNSWMRLSDENEAEWEMFQAFKNDFRSIPDTVRHFYPDRDFNTAKIYVYSIAKKHHWKARVADFDRWVGKQGDDATRKAVQDIARASTDRIVHIVNDLQHKYNIVSKRVERKLQEESNEDMHLGAVQMLTTIGKGLIAEYKDLRLYAPDEVKQEGKYADKLEGAAARMAALMEKQAENTPENKELLQ